MVARMGREMFSLKPIITTLNLLWMLSHCRNKDCWFGQMATSWPLNRPICNDPRSLVTNRVPTLCVGAHYNFFQASFLFLPNNCLVWWCVMNLILSFIFLSPNCQHVRFQCTKRSIVHIMQGFIMQLVTQSLMHHFHIKSLLHCNCCIQQSNWPKGVFV